MAMNHRPGVAGRSAIAVRVLPAAAADDAGLVDELADLVNDVYAAAERGLWRDEATRTTASELAELIRSGEIAVAIRHGQIVGSLRLHDVSGDTSELGMLVASPDERSTGVGTALIEFAEQRSWERGRRAVQLELLVPRTWSHPSKEFLKAWYGRRGYRLVRTGSIDDAYPQLAPLLATPCDLEVHAKPLRSTLVRSGSR
jgi:GNAT superfamily N-acetyltransferase